MDKINILGGDFFSHSKWKYLLELLKSVPVKKAYHLHYLNAFDREQELKTLATVNDEMVVVVNFPVNVQKLGIVVESIVAIDINCKYIFVIKDEPDLQRAESLISSYNISNPEFKAFYTGNNLNFFERNLYIERQDIEEERPSLNDIYTRGSVNSVDFGYLTVLSNGKIYANVNNPGLGILGKDSVYNILMKELNNGNSWRKIRKNVLPCKRCTFEMLCPPITNYNISIGKNDLCHILPTVKIENK